MDLEVRHLRMLSAIAEAGSMTKAAAALGLSQPTLTRQIQRLERFMGGPLFLRERDGVRPTALGTFVLDRANAVLPVLDGIGPASANLCGRIHELREVRIGARPGPLLCSLLHRITELLPTAEVRTDENTSSAALAELLDHGRLDIGLLNECSTYEPCRRPGLEFHVIVVEPVFVRVAATHPLAGRDEIELADLAAEIWAAPPPTGRNDDEEMYAACARAGFVPRIRHRAGDTQANELVRNQHAVLLCQPLLPPAPGTVDRPLAGTPMRVRRLLAHRRDGALARQADKLATLLTEDYLSQVEANPVYRRWTAAHGPWRD